MSWKESIKKDSWKSTIQPGWKSSIMRSKPITPAEMKADVLKTIMPEIKEKLSWKNTLSIEPKNGLDGLNGKDGKTGKNGKNGKDGSNGLDGKSIVGPKGDSGINGTNGSKILFLDSKPVDEGNDGDLVLINKTFEIFYKENGEWIKKGSLLGKSGKTNFVGGLNGESAYQIAVRLGFVGTEQEWLDSLQGSGGGGGSTRTVSAISSNTTAGSTAGTDYIYLISNSAVLTLPTAVGNENIYSIKMTDASGCSVACFGGQTIDGSAVMNLVLQYESRDLVSDGSNWVVI